MAALTATPITVGGVAANPRQVVDGDTVNANDVDRGAILEIHNAAVSSITVTFTDPGHTPAGNTGTQAGVTVAAGATKRFKPTMAFADASGNVTVHYSSVTSVTYDLYY